jgi:hypothetical protein
MTRQRPAVRQKAAARTTIAVQGARVHKLKNISLEIPRDRLVVLRALRAIVTFFVVPFVIGVRRPTTQGEW